MDPCVNLVPTQHWSCMAPNPLLPFGLRCVLPDGPLAPPGRESGKCRVNWRLAVDKQDEARELRRVIDGLIRGDLSVYTGIRGRLERFVAIRFSACPEESEDLVSEIVTALLESLRQRRFHGESRGALIAYIYGIARMKLMTALKLRRKQAAIQDEMLKPGNPSTSVDQEVLDREMVTAIHAALDEKCAELLTLKFLRGWSDQEIADYKKLTKNAASTAIWRCIAKAQQLKIVREFLYKNRRDEKSNSVEKS